MPRGALAAVVPMVAPTLAAVAGSLITLTPGDGEAAPESDVKTSTVPTTSGMVTPSGSESVSIAALGDGRLRLVAARVAVLITAI